MSALFKEPLLHFLVLGAAIFAFYNWASRDVRSDDEIVVTAGQQQHMLNVFARTWQRPATRQEFEGLIREFIREELAFREGKAMGFDEGDTVIRRRMRQKLELLTDEIVGLDEPSEEELQEFLDVHPEQFRQDAVIDFHHVYFSSDRRGERMEADALEALELLQSGAVVDWSELGDPISLGSTFQQMRTSEIERQFGKAFSSGLGEVQTGAWTGPVQSAYGMHLVFVDNLIPARNPELSEVRERVRNEWFATRRQQATDELYEKIAEKYSIMIENLDQENGP